VPAPREYLRFLFFAIHHSSDGLPQVLAESSAPFIYHSVLTLVAARAVRSAI
jgi:hypothetical protein